MASQNETVLRMCDAPMATRLRDLIERNYPGRDFEEKYSEFRRDLFYSRRF